MKPWQECDCNVITPFSATLSLRVKAPKNKEKRKQEIKKQAVECKSDFTCNLNFPKIRTAYFVVT
jgi:hypothetical protein